MGYNSVKCDIVTINHLLGAQCHPDILSKPILLSANIGTSATSQTQPVYGYALKIDTALAALGDTVTVVLTESTCGRCPE